MVDQNDSKTSIFSRRDFLKVSSITAGALATASLIKAPIGFARDAYPSEKITLIVPHKAGGGHDRYGRMLSPYISKYLKEFTPGAKEIDIMVKNEASAAGRKGYSMLFNAKPDGYTLSVIDTSPITDTLFEKPEFDFTQLTFLILGRYTYKGIITSKKGFNSWNDLVNAMKKEPVKLGAGSFGRTNHIASIIMNEKVGTKFKLINFPGNMENVNAVIRGDVQAAMVDLDSVQGVIDAKEVKVLLTFTETNEYPGSVIIKDIGYPHLAQQICSHSFVVAPPGLDMEAKKRLIAAIRKASTDKDFLALAKKAEIPIANIYDMEARDVFLNFSKFYWDNAAMLKKYLS